MVTQSELSKLENGTRRVDFLLLIKLAELYNRPISFFVPKK
ncbi:helix-turn-helix transcriptional regulator [Dysgonomonas sp. Marseille-P4677]|nr:helix-turn-helix transcriptional regulator [Dysgonomonas sp. Marseille-P4677]